MTGYEEGMLERLSSSKETKGNIQHFVKDMKIYDITTWAQEHF